MQNKIYADETVNKCKRYIKLHNDKGFISITVINRKLANTAVFTNRKYGSAWAIRNAVNILVLDGFMTEVEPGIYKVN